MAMLNNQMVIDFAMYVLSVAIFLWTCHLHSIGHGGCMTASWSASFYHPGQTVNVEGIINPEIAMEKSGNTTTSVVVVAVAVVVVVAVVVAVAVAVAVVVVAVAAVAAVAAVVVVVVLIYPWIYTLIWWFHLDDNFPCVFQKNMTCDLHCTAVVQARLYNIIQYISRTAVINAYISPWHIHEYTIHQLDIIWYHMIIYIYIYIHIHSTCTYIYYISTIWIICVCINRNQSFFSNGQVILGTQPIPCQPCPE